MNVLPDKPGWWWWRSVPELDPFPVYVAERLGGSCPDWGVYSPAPHMTDLLGIILRDTGRTVATMGGVWLGPCEPPPERED